MVLTRSQTSTRDDDFLDALPAQNPPTSTTINNDNENQTTVNSRPLTFSPIPNLKIPQFWSSLPEAWFLQVDLQFQLHNITNDDTKYQFIITSLSQDAILKVLDIVQNPPLTQKYDAVKEALCKRFSLSEESRLEAILSDSQLGDRKPSDLFHELTILAGPLSFVSRELIFKLWLRKLPRNVQLHLTSSRIPSIDEKVILADNIFQLSNPSTSVMNSTEISQVNLLQNFAELTSKLNENIDKLTLNVDALNNMNTTNSNAKKFSKNPSRSFHNRRNEYVCWYHSRFGDKALKCEESCSFFRSFQSKPLN